jgi:hypothetical protein
MRVDRQTNMTKLIVALRNFPKAPKNARRVVVFKVLCFCVHHVGLQTHLHPLVSPVTESFQ